MAYIIVTLCGNLKYYVQNYRDTAIVLNGLSDNAISFLRESMAWRYVDELEKQSERKFHVEEVLPRSR